MKEINGQTSSKLNTNKKETFQNWQEYADVMFYEENVKPNQ